MKARGDEEGVQRVDERAGSVSSNLERERRKRRRE